QLGLQTPLERGLDQRGYEPAVTGQLDLPGVDLLEEGAKLPRGIQLFDQVLARGLVRLFLVRHGHDSYRSSQYVLHSPSDTPHECDHGDAQRRRHRKGHDQAYPAECTEYVRAKVVARPVGQGRDDQRCDETAEVVEAQYPTDL